MNVTITRRKPDGSFNPDEGTPGVLSIEGSAFSCATLELPWRDNEPDKSRIPAGTYQASLVSTVNPALMPKVYALENVPGRSNVLIHNGNFAGDTAMGFKSDVEGCTLLGSMIGTLDNGNGSAQLAVLNSRPMVTAFNGACNFEPITVTYRDAA